MNLDNLLKRCKSNDAKSQQELYDLFKAKVMGLCRRYAHSREEAQDVCQETFIRIFQHIGQLRNVNHLESWVRATAVNASINYYHKHKRHDHEEERNGFHKTADDHDLILSHLTDEELIGVINSLPDGYRMVFNLYEVEGYSHAEIGGLLKISEATSRSQLNRAKHALKEKLKTIGISSYEKYP